LDFRCRTRIRPRASEITPQIYIPKQFWKSIFGKLTVFGDLSIAILTSPSALYSQNDELIYGGAFRYRLTPRANLVGEVAGLYTPRKITPALLGTESRGQGRLGVQIMAGGLIWDFAGIAGLTKNDPRTGFTFGVSKDLQLFNRSKTQ
jgi:hypothetical protein